MLFWPNSFRFGVQEVTSAKSEQKLWCILRLSCVLLGFIASSVGFKSMSSTLSGVSAHQQLLCRVTYFSTTVNNLWPAVLMLDPSVWFLQKLFCQRHFDTEAIKERATHALSWPPSLTGNAKLTCECTTRPHQTPPSSFFLCSFHWWKGYMQFGDEITFQLASDSLSLFPALAHIHPPSALLHLHLSLCAFCLL